MGEAVKNNCLALNSAKGKDIFRNKEIIGAAVEQNGLMLCYADAQVKKDKELLKKALKNTPQAYACADEVAQRDVDVKNLAKIDKDWEGFQRHGVTSGDAVHSITA